MPNSKATSHFERGFKTWAENTALTVRARLKVGPADPLPYSSLAKHLNVRIWELSEIPGLPRKSLNYLSSRDGDDWSAVTVTGTVTIVVANPSHSAARRTSSIMHELAHVLRGHQETQVIIADCGITLRAYNAVQEAEADWLAGCLCLPRPAMEYCFRRRLTEEQACARYSISKNLYNYRRNVTGIAKQFGLLRNSRSKKRA